MTFVDTGAWFALYVSSDPNHRPAAQWLAANTGPLLTTNYVIDETLTLMRARGNNARAIAFGTACFSGELARVHTLTTDEIYSAWVVFRDYTDKDWSFTDCTSKVVIESLAIPTAFTFDHHFRQFGSVAVVP